MNLDASWIWDERHEKYYRVTGKDAHGEFHLTHIGGMLLIVQAIMCTSGIRRPLRPISARSRPT
jgi:hypothetical protein